MSGDKIAHSFQVLPDHVEFLKEMVRKYDLPDIDKAVRILCDYAMEDGDQDEIFKDIRCLHC